MKLLRVGAIVSIAWYVAAALTPMTSVAIRNSTMDSTAIGNSSASSANFTYQHVQGPPPTPLPSQGQWSGWNYLGAGESDNFTHPGLGSGGYNWFKTNSSGSGATSLMSLSSTGGLSVGSVTAANIVAPTTATVGLLGIAGLGYGSGSPQGGYIEWNTTGQGETDFVNSRGVGAGGFNWYLASTGATPPGPAMTLSSGGLTNTSGFVGPLTGNASTASAFNHTPSACGTGQVAAGINSAGNASCVNTTQSAAGPGGVTSSGSFSTTSSVAVLSPGYGDTGYQAACTLVGPSDPRASIYGIQKTATTVTVLVTTNGSAAISYAGVDCLVKHN